MSNPSASWEDVARVQKDIIERKDSEIAALRARVAELKRENTDLRWRITELAQTAEDLRHEVDEWKRAAKGEK
jgi:predicted RNase H-like nuclease (RuvC/YqgF family)